VPLLVSLDACRQQLAADGQALVGRALELADDAHRRLRMLPGLDVLGPVRLGLGPVPEQALSPREAFFSPSRRVRLQDAAGEVAAGRPRQLTPMRR
jgi:hypothetical protein